MITKFKKRWVESISGLGLILGSLGVKIDVQMLTDALHSVDSTVTLVAGVVAMLSAAFRAGHTKDEPE